MDIFIYLVSGQFRLGLNDTNIEIDEKYIYGPMFESPSLYLVQISTDDHIATCRVQKSFQPLEVTGTYYAAQVWTFLG